jgi:hypothetical protein
MPEFNTAQNVAQGIATGRSIPNQNTGMADLIKSITGDLRTAAKNRLEQQNKVREQNVDIAKSLLTAKYQPKDMNKFLETGDLSHWDVPGNTGFGGMGSGMQQFLQMDRSTLPPGGGLTYREGNLTARLAPESDTARSARISRTTLVRDLNIMQQLFSGVPTGEGPGARVAGAWKALSAVTGSYPELKTYNDYKDGILGRLVITIGGESGSRLSDQDVKRMQALFPNEYSTIQEATIKWALLKNAVNETAQMYGSKAKMVLTPEEAAVLKQLTPEQRADYGDTGKVWGAAPNEKSAKMYNKLKQQVAQRYGQSYITNLEREFQEKGFPQEFGAGDMLEQGAGGGGIFVRSSDGSTIVEIDPEYLDQALSEGWTQE